MVNWLNQPGIFNEFYRSKPSIQLGYNGIGLGLAISKQLIEMHGGTIGLYSSAIEGRGSTFFFTLPVVPSQESVIPKNLSLVQDKKPAIAYIAEQSEIPGLLKDLFS